MRYYYLVIPLFCFCCRNKQTVQAPHFYHKPDTLFNHEPDSLVLSLADTVSGKWEYFLLTPRQPILLRSIARGGKIVIPFQFKDQFSEGPAAICCTKNGIAFFYPLQLVYRAGDETVAVKKDYHSPKTVNPDSSLMQQRIIFVMNQQRNLLRLPPNFKKGPTRYFFSDSIRLKPVTAIYLPEPSYPVSAIYVQPGTDIPFGLTAKYVAGENAFIISTGCIKDKYENIVADGTSVSFLYRNNNSIYRMEAPSWQGIATVKIPADASQTFTVSAVINEFHSKSITITASK